MPDVTPEATPGQAAAHSHFGQAGCACPPSCGCHEPLTVKPSDDVPGELARVLAECGRLRQEADGLREQLRLANADWVIAATDRDDYAERLKATDQSWAKVAAERDRYRQALDYFRKTAPAPLARVAIAALEGNHG